MRRTPSSADWPRYTQSPPVGALVHILAMAHLRAKQTARFSDEDTLAGGMFAEIELANGTVTRDGSLRVITVPKAVRSHPRYRDWVWAHAFPFVLDNDGPERNTMILQVVPDDVACVVRAFVALSRTSNNMPVVVPDGWLC